MPKRKLNVEPTGDGFVGPFKHMGASRTPYFRHRHRVIFINGMDNSPRDHMHSALALSVLQMCTVIGVYNRTEGAGTDFLQCVGDYLQGEAFHETNRMGRELHDQLSAYMHAHGLSPANVRLRAQVMEQAIGRNVATAAMFRLLRSPTYRECDIIAHSQGNLITRNALQAVQAVDGLSAIRARHVYCYGSPAYNWPSGVHVHQHAYTLDPITWLSGIDFSTSKIGLPTGAPAYWPFCHNFISYLRDDARFIVNRYRWGSLGMSLSIDEEGLANALFRMRTNVRRVYRVMKLLSTSFSCDADDVAVLYVKKLMKGRVASGDIIRAMQHYPILLKLLIKVMDDGWTDGEEYAAIRYLSDFMPASRSRR